MKAESKGVAAEEIKLAGEVKAGAQIKKIVFACDAGMGSSDIGATKLRKELEAVGLGAIKVIHAPVSEVPPTAEVIVCHTELQERAKAALVTITDFLNAPEYNELIRKLRQK
jgi:PTS system mannitol-specific IIC component